MFHIIEVDGKLFKVIETKIDSYNTIRKTVPLAEEELEKITDVVTKQHEEERTALVEAKAKGKVKKKAEIDKVKDMVDFKNDVPRKEILKKKTFAVG